MTIHIEDIAVGDERAIERVITAAEIEAFGQATGDRNPVHFCEDYAGGTVFRRRIAHGMLTAGLISAVIGEDLPGHGTIYLGQSLRFRRPVFPGDTVRAVCRVTAVDRDRARVTLDCRCWVGDTVVLEGEATVIAPSRMAVAAE